MFEEILADTKHESENDNKNKDETENIVEDLAEHIKDEFNETKIRSSCKISIIQEKIAAAEKLKTDTQNEIKKYLNIKCDAAQNQITKLMYYCTHLETNNKKLEDSLTRMIRQHFEKIDLVKDAIRRLSLIETELECQVQKLKVRLLELEDANKRQSEFIRIMEEKVSQIGVGTIKELQCQMVPLEEENRKLETAYFDVKRDQEELIGALQHKERLLKIERTQQESDIKRLSAGLQFMDNTRKDIEKNIQITKVHVKQNSIKEMKKIAKLTAVWRDLSERHRNVFKEKMQVENENLYLKQKIDKLYKEILTY